jgi:hypothetical protein
MSKRWHSQGCLAIGLALAILSLGSETAFGQSSRSQVKPGWMFCIRVDDRARVSRRTLATAFHVAGRVLQAAGVPTEWHTGPTEKTNSEGRNCLILSVTGRAFRDVSPEALGFALPNTHRGPDITVFYDRIERLEMRAVSSAASVPQILGYAMAHEIGHVLLGSRQHSSEGIMKGGWSEEEFERLAKGWLGFTPEQSAVMRENAFRRATLQQSAKAKPKSEGEASNLEVKTSSGGQGSPAFLDANLSNLNLAETTVY